jgi:hypothetical protein
MRCVRQAALLLKLQPLEREAGREVQMKRYSERDKIIKKSILFELQTRPMSNYSSDYFPLMFDGKHLIQ